MTDEDFLQRQLEQGKKTSPLMAAPGVTTKIFRRDWLHIVDQGVGADFLGNCFKTFLPFMPGGNKKERRLALWDRIRAFYDANAVRDRMTGVSKHPKRRLSLKQVQLLQEL